MQRALEAVWALLYAQVPGARFERRGDLIFALYPALPIPQCNGPWVVEDTEEAADALAEAVAEVEATGVPVWVQTRSGQERTQRAAAELGLTNRATQPGMVIRPSELAAPSVDGLVVDTIAADEIATANEVLAESFGAPRELFDAFTPLRAAGSVWRASPPTVTAIAAVAGSFSPHSGSNR